MKVKITVEDVQRFELACEANDAKIVESRKFGKKTVVIISVRSARQVYNRYLCETNVATLAKPSRGSLLNTPLSIAA
jgi:hypothetical protein